MTDTLASVVDLRRLLVVLLCCVAGCATVRGRLNDTAGRLRGTAWRLDEIAGAPVVEGVEATLEFPDAGKVAGKGSCNRFTGTVKVSGGSIHFGPLASARMACADPVGRQEAAYFAALAVAERYVVNGTALAIYSVGSEPSLRFTRTKP